jgi:hypothetical protein
MDNRHILSLGTVLIVLGMVFFSVFGCRKPDSPPSPATPNSWLAEYVPEASATASLFNRYQIHKAQKDYQDAYLDLIQKMTNMEVRKLSPEQQKSLFNNYLASSQKYQGIVKKIREEEEILREKCNSIMRSLISGILVYDKMSKTKMFKFEAQKLIKLGILKEPPQCPRNGTYSIYYKDGRRSFFCTVHGTLKQR